MCKIYKILCDNLFSVCNWGLIPHMLGIVPKLPQIINYHAIFLLFNLILQNTCRNIVQYAGHTSLPTVIYTFTAIQFSDLPLFWRIFLLPDIFSNLEPPALAGTIFCFLPPLLPRISYCTACCSLPSCGAFYPIPITTSPLSNQLHNKGKQLQDTMARH